MSESNWYEMLNGYVDENEREATDDYNWHDCCPWCGEDWEDCRCDEEIDEEVRRREDR